MPDTTSPEATVTVRDRMVWAWNDIGRKEWGRDLVGATVAGVIGAVAAPDEASAILLGVVTGLLAGLLILAAQFVGNFAERAEPAILRARLKEIVYQRNELLAKATPKPRITVFRTPDAVRFEVHNDGATAVFRARYQILEAHPPLDHASQMNSRDVHWLRLSESGRDSPIFAADFDMFEVPLSLRSVHGIPSDFFAKHYQMSDVSQGRMTEGELMTPPPASRWLDIGIVVTSDTLSEAHSAVFRVYHDRTVKR